MASACVNNISVSPEGFPGKTYGWLSPRISLSREYPDDGAKVAASKPQEVDEVVDLEVSAGDFEFRLEDPVGMLPADELFSDGKLVPLQISSLRISAGSLVGSPESGKYGRREVTASVDPYLFSPKAPRCSSRWRELLGLKKLHQNQKSSDSVKTASFSSDSVKTASFYASSSSKSLKNLLHRSSKSSFDASLSLPLLKETDSESVSISSSRLSLSSSSSGHDHDDHRLSLDSDKTAPNPFKPSNPNPPRMRFVRPAAASAARSSPMRRAAAAEPAANRGVSVDSPRMNSSGKIVFQSLERSSSSPSSFNGGPRFKHRGMERSYSANVRVTPVLNVPVCSLPVFGFGQLFTPQKRDNNGVASNGTRTHHHHHQNNSNGTRNRSDRA